jgi:hypothetical protein
MQAHSSVCVCVCLCVYVCVCACVCVCVCARVSGWRHAGFKVQAQVLNMSIMNLHVTHIHIHTHVHIRTREQGMRRTHTHTQTFTQTRTHTHTPAQSVRRYQGPRKRCVLHRGLASRCPWFLQSATNGHTRTLSPCMVRCMRILRSKRKTRFCRASAACVLRAANAFFAVGTRGAADTHKWCDDMEASGRQAETLCSGSFS